MAKGWKRQLRIRTVAFGLLLAQLWAGAADAQSPWRDPSPHQVRLVTVDSTVRLEVLDWGGVRRPVVFVGCYLTGHVYDDIAPKLTDQFHVYAVTRRSVGASDHPKTGYGPQRRAHDILEVVTALKMQQPILIGNSCGGDILHTLGAMNPDRIGGLMYVDAAEDPTLTLEDYDWQAVDPGQLPERIPPDAVSFPEAETRQGDQWPLEPAIQRAIVEDNRVRSEYARIRVPVVAIYRTATMEQVLREPPARSEQERAAVVQVHERGRAMTLKWQTDLLAGVPRAKIVELSGANLYMFLSDEEDIIRELREFASSLPTPSGPER
jgi:pimeloyl-ACP methyl ester carboxylesterase